MDICINKDIKHEFTKMIMSLSILKNKDNLYNDFHSILKIKVDIKNNMFSEIKYHISTKDTITIDELFDKYC